MQLLAGHAKVLAQAAGCLLLLPPLLPLEWRTLRDAAVQSGQEQASRSTLAGAATLLQQHCRQLTRLQVLLTRGSYDAVCLPDTIAATAAGMSLRGQCCTM
jgi:hypothetical protein